MRSASWLSGGLAAGLVLSACVAFAASDAPKPQYGKWGFDLAGADFKAKPGDDFFRYANGTWLDHTQIPADKPAYSLRLAMTDTTEQRLHEIMEAAAATVAHAPTTTEGKVGAFYKSFMNEANVEKLGASPLKAHLDAIRAAKSRDDIAALMGRSNFDFNAALFGTYIDIDIKNPKIYAVTANQSGLGLPDRDYYLKKEFEGPRAKYHAYVASLLKLLNWPGADKHADEILALETRVAQASWTRVQDRDPVATYNPMTIAELEKLSPGFSWSRYLGEAKLGGLKRIIVAEKSAFPKLAAIFAGTPLETLKAWQAFTMADSAAPYLSKAFTDASFEMHNKTLSGQLAQSARWKRGVHTVSGGDFLAGDRVDRFGNIGWAVGELYTAKYFPPSSKAKIEDLIQNLKAAFRARLVKLDWMSEKTKAQALKKLDTYNIKVGYPDHNRDYSKLVILDDDVIGNVQRAAEADWDFYVRRMNGPVDRSDWGMTPQTNDAYNGTLRDIVFPAGILQPPMFDANADPAINYGAAGGVIGHEMTHGFDDQGRKFDAEGALRDWWTLEDAKTFETRAKILGEQYSKFEPIPGVKVNGDLTMGENIADLGGLTMALEAYHASLKGKPAPVLDGLTGDQRVFLGWAQAWRGKLRDETIRKMVVSDPHSPRMFRVNGPMRNIDAWYAAFGVKPGDKLYIEPSKRVRLW
ncbi:MAG: M13 family metallopeptidase [Proteobacteria bacterium]|nr:M13 family metallopeptidase [Pseudomonadota bacterium]